jgi:hypothetical protein
MVKGGAHDVCRIRNRHCRPASDPRVAWLAIGQRVKRRRAKRREVEERDRQEQLAEQERREQNDSTGSQSRKAFKDKGRFPGDSKGKPTWVTVDHSEGSPTPQPPPENASPGAIDVVVIRISAPGRGAGQPVTLTITRHEVPVTPERGETPHDLVRKAMDRLEEEMEDTASAAAGQNIANRILPVQGPAVAAPVVQLKSDLHSVFLGQSVLPFAQYVPLPGIDGPLDTAELAILVGGIVLGAVTGHLALSTVCVKSLAHEAIANSAEEVIKEAIDSALFDYRASVPKPQAQDCQISLGTTGGVSPGGPGDGPRPGSLRL